MKEFIVANWRVLVFAVLALIEITILIFKKSAKVDSTKEKISQNLPLYISMAESLFTDQGSGAKKLDFVVMSVKQLLGIKSTDYDDFINSQIESILSTPLKKMEKGNHEK